MFYGKKANRRKELFKDLLYGAVGGIVGTYAMEPVTSLLYRYEREEARKREESLRREAPFLTLAGRLLALVGAEATEGRKRPVGKVVHWGYGIAWGALYGVLRNRVPVLSRGAGLLFGTAFFLLGDELMNTLMGLTPPPKAFPPEAHIRGLAGHLAFSAAAEGTYRALSAALG